MSALRRRSTEPQVYLFYVPGSSTARRNFAIAMAAGTWGVPETARGPRGGVVLREVKRGDIVVFVRGWKSDGAARGGRIPRDEYIGTYESIVGVVVTRSYYSATSPVLWTDDSYPHRFDFRPEALFRGHDIPCNPKALGGGLHALLHRISTSGSMEPVDSTMILKLMSLCTK